MNQPYITLSYLKIMVSFWKPVAYATALLLLSGLVASLGGVSGAPIQPSTPHACTNAPSLTIQSQSVRGFFATVSGTAIAGAGAGCLINIITIQWGDGATNTQYNFSYQANFSFTHNYATAGSYPVTVTARDSSGLSTTSNLVLAVHGPPYDVQVAFDRAYHLPGDRAVLYINVYNSTTGGLQTSTSSLTFFVTTCYDQQTNPGVCTPVNTISSHPAATNATAIPFTVPPDAIGDSTLTVQVEANATLPTGLFSENSSVTNLWISSPQLPNVCVGSTIGGGGSACAPNTAQIQPGQNFVLTIYGSVSGPSGTEPWVGGSVLVTFYLNNQQVSPGFPKYPLITNSSGVAQGVVQTAGLGTGDLNITAAISDPSNAAVQAMHETVFVNIAASPAAQVQVTVGSAGYYGGDTLAASFVVTSFTGHPVSGWSANAYYIFGDAGSLTTTGACGVTNLFLAEGPLSGTSGNVPSYAIPTSFSGVLTIEVQANNATASVYGSVCTLVSPPKLLVQPSEVVYHSGDTIHVSFTPEGQVFNTASYFASVSGTGTNGNTVIIYNQTLGTSTSFQFTIPSSGTLPTYTLTVIAQNTTGVIAGQDLQLYEYSGYALVVSIATPSQYSDGSYQPGESVTFSYTLASLGLATPPKFFTLSAGFLNTQQGETVIQETSTSGSFTLQVPSSTGTGISLVVFNAGIPTPTGGQTVGTDVALLVNPSPSALNYEIGAGSGFTVSDILVIVILIVAALLVFLLWRRRHPREPGMVRPHKKRFGKSEPEPANAGGVQTWEQPAPEGGAPPAAEQGAAPASEPGAEYPPPMPPPSQ